MVRRTYSDGKTAGDRIPERSTDGDGKGGRFLDLGGKQSMAVVRDPARDRKAQVVLEAFAEDINAVEGETVAKAWLREMLELYGLFRVIK